MYHVSNLFEQMTYADFGLSHDIIGTKETVSGITSVDFRTFLSSWYGLPNMLLVLAGDAKTLKSKKTLQMVEAAFSKKTDEPRVKNKVKLRKYLSQKPLSESHLHIEHKATEQAHLVLGWKGIPRSDTENRHALSLLGTLMGGNMSSRLFSEVREKRGLCYYVRADVDYYHEVGLVGASAGVDPKRVYEAIEVIIDEFNQVASGKRPVTEEELNRAKEYIRGTLTLSFEDSRSVAQSFGMKELLLDKVETLEESLAKMQAVTLDQVNELAALLFKTAKPKLAVIGPFEDKTKFESLIS
jgi:predicted Zn-dependent peptidase